MSPLNADIIATLLRDRTTERNILWANVEFGAQEIQIEQVPTIVPRHEKNRADQKSRTRARAEIFTPHEVCNLQNELVCKKFVGQAWIEFVDAKFLEITCGEAPYIVNRYDAATGERIPIAERGGLLDRKLRVAGNETKTFADWIECAIRAVKSVYGYEFQRDNLFLARRNILLSVADYFTEKVSVKPRTNLLMTVAEIVSWNFWQMDGLTNSPPFTESANLFGGVNCRIKDWRTNKIFEFVELLGGERR